MTYCQLTDMHLMSTRARPSSKLQNVRSRVLDVRFWSDQDHSTWILNLNTFYVSKVLYGHFFTIYEIQIMFFEKKVFYRFLKITVFLTLTFFESPFWCICLIDCISLVICNIFTILFDILKWMVVEKRLNLRFAQAEFPLSYPAEYEKSHYDLIQPPGSILCYLAWPKTHWPERNSVPCKS